MKNKISTTHIIILAIAPLLFGCRGSVKEENNNNALAVSVSPGYGAHETNSIDTKESIVKWKGSNVAGTNSHTGYISISKGALHVENGQLVGGTAEVAMNTIEDENHDRDNMLVTHLKGTDFFDVERFPVSTIVLTKAVSTSGENKKVTGNLTIKGITHPVTFPARIEVKGGVVKMDGKLVIDRTLWDVRYKSGKFFDNLADGAISDSIAFDIKIVAKKIK